MSNDLYKILNNFNKLTEQKSHPYEKKMVAQPKTQLHESIERVQENRPPMDDQKPGTAPHRTPVGLGGTPEQVKGSKAVPKPYSKEKSKVHTANIKKDVEEGIFDTLKQKFFSKPMPMPKDGEIIRVNGREVKISYVTGGYIGFTWRDKEGTEHTEEVYRGDYRGLRSPGEELTKDIAAEIRHADNPGPMDPGAQAIIDRKRAEDPQLDDIMRRREEDEAEKTDFATMRTSSTIHEQGIDQTNNIKQMLLRSDRQLMTINRQLMTSIADIFQSGIELTSDQETLLSQILDKLMDIRNIVQGRDVTEDKPTINMTENSEELAKQFADFLTSKGIKFRQGPPQRRPESPPRDYSADIAALPELRAELAAMQERYARLGGSNWQYADREQNLTDSEREARAMEQPMQRLAMRIRDAEQAQKSSAEGMTEEQQDESALQAYLGKKKYGEKGMKALQQAGREGASKEKMAKIRAQHDKMDESVQLDEKAVSKAQQKFMGMVHATKKGKPAPSPEVAKVAKGMSNKAARDFAATKHKGLPKHVNETIIRALQEGFSRDQIVEYLLENADKDYWRDLIKDIPEKGKPDRTVHKGHYGTEYQGDTDEDDDDGKKKISKPTGEKRGRGRPKGVKNRVVRAGEKKAVAQPSGEKRGRGRPAGSKNKVKESWIVENNNWIAEAYAAMVEKQEPKRLPAPMEPTYIRDPKTGELVPDIDYKLNPHLRPAPKPAPNPAPKPATDKKSEVDGEEGIAEMMRLAGLSEKLHGKQHKLDADKDGKLEKSDFAKLRASKNEEQLDEKMYFDPATGQITDRTFKPQMAQSAPVDNTQFKADVDRAKSGLYMKPEDPKVYSRERGLGPSMAADRLEKRGVDIPGLVGNRVNPATMDSGPGMNEADMEEGNEFSGALAKAKASGAKEFEVDGKTYQVKESKLDECGEMGPMANGMASEQPGKLNVSTNMSSDGTKSVTVTADGDAALELMQILSLAGMKNVDRMNTPEVTVATMEEKDSRYQASTTPEEEVLPLEMQLKGGDGEVAGKEKKMNKHGSARFSDNPLSTEEMKESISLKMMKEYEGIKVKS